MRTKYDDNLLQALADEFNTPLCSETDELVYTTKITGECQKENCNNLFCVKFATINASKKPYCTKCIRKMTNLEIHGIESPMHKDSVKQTRKLKSVDKFKTLIQELQIKLNAQFWYTDPDETLNLHTVIYSQCKNDDCPNLYHKIIYTLQTETKDGIICQLCKTKQTNLEIYGTECVLQNQSIKDQIKHTNIDRYGVENPLMSQDVQNRCKETIKATYGVDNPSQAAEVKDKKKETTLKNYGVENPFQSEEIKEKIKETNLERYGVEHASQDPDIAERQLANRYQRHEFTFKDGDTRVVQGYEPQALKYLEDSGYSSYQILTSKKDMPPVWYHSDNRYHKYSPDIFIPNDNLIIEVKSTFTRKINADKIRHTRKACTYLGYDFKLWIFDKNGTLLWEE